MLMRTILILASLFFLALTLHHIFYILRPRDVVNGNLKEDRKVSDQYTNGRMKPLIILLAASHIVYYVVAALVVNNRFFYLYSINMILYMISEQHRSIRTQEKIEVDEEYYPEFGGKKPGLLWIIYAMVGVELCYYVFVLFYSGVTIRHPII